MKNNKLFTLGFLVSLLGWPLLAFAQYGLGEAATPMGYNQEASIFSYATQIVGVILAFTGFIFFGFMMYAGIRWMTTRGNEELAEKAKNTLQAATTGFIIVVLSYALTVYLVGALRGNSDAERISCTPVVEIADPQTGLKTYKDTCSADTNGRGSCVDVTQQQCPPDTNAVLDNCCPGGNNIKCCVPLK